MERDVLLRWLLDCGIDDISILTDCDENAVWEAIKSCRENDHQLSLLNIMEEVWEYALEHTGITKKYPQAIGDLSFDNNASASGIYCTGDCEYYEANLSEEMEEIEQIMGMSFNW